MSLIFAISQANDKILLSLNGDLIFQYSLVHTGSDKPFLSLAAKFRALQIVSVFCSIINLQSYLDHDNL